MGFNLKYPVHTVSESRGSSLSVAEGLTHNRRIGNLVSNIRLNIENFLELAVLMFFAIDIQGVNIIHQRLKAVNS